MAACDFLKFGAILFAVFTATSGQLSINVQLTQSVATEGDNVNVTCEIFQEEDTAFFIVWMRIVDGVEYEIGTNAHVNGDFMKTGKYVATVTIPKKNDIKHVIFTLQMLDVDSSHNGKIGCKVPIQNIKVFKPFTVKIPVSEIRMMSLDVNGTHAEAYVDGQSVTFQEGEVRQWVCRVNGSYPEPTVAIYGGGKDISDRFTKQVTLMKSGPIPGLQKLWYEVKMSNNALPIEYEFSNSTLECRATVGNSEPNVTAIFVELSGFKPKFLCSKTRVVGSHTPNVNVTCLVKADPPVKDVKFTWTQISTDNETLEAGEGKGHYQASILPGKDKFETFMVLKIDRVFSQHFRKYYFMAENDLGKVTHEIELLQDNNGDGTNGGVLASLSGALLTLFCAILLGL